MPILYDWVGLHEVFWNKTEQTLLTVPLKQYAWQTAWCHNQVNDLDTGEERDQAWHFHPLFSNIFSGHCQTDGTKDIRITHCKENPIYVFLSWELRGLGPNSHIHVTVSDLYIPRICPHISLQQNRQTDPGNI
jgi:hypothetical protein